MNRTLANSAALLVLRVFVWVALTLGDEPTGQQAIVPERAVQLQIEKAAQAYLTNDLEVLESARLAFDEQFRLHQLVNWDKERLVRQLIYYRMHPRSRRSVIMLPVVYSEADISDGELFGAVLPYIDTSDPVLGRQIQCFLHQIEGVSSPSHPPEYDKYYVPHIAANRHSPPLALIEYMYRNAPGEALRACDSVFKVESNDTRKILLGVRTIDDAIWKRQKGFLAADEAKTQIGQELQALMLHDRWWVRLYVAGFLRSNPEFQSETLLVRLAGDAHPSVRKMVEEAEEERKKFKSSPVHPVPRFGSEER